MRRRRRLRRRSGPGPTASNGGIAGLTGAALAAIVTIVLIVAALAGAVGGAERAPNAAADCVRWYPDYCVPADRGALDCDDLRRTPVRVEGADPFDFDSDLSGTGCEPG